MLRKIISVLLILFLMVLSIKSDYVEINNKRVEVNRPFTSESSHINYNNQKYPTTTNFGINEHVVVGGQNYYIHRR